MSQPIKVAVAVVVHYEIVGVIVDLVLVLVHVTAVDPRNLPLKFG